jgi:hypothetical protein
MLNLNDIKSLKYFLVYSVAVIAFFVYAGLTGWRWFHSTKTEETPQHATRTYGASRYYHK